MPVDQSSTVRRSEPLNSQTIEIIDEPMHSNDPVLVAQRKTVFIFRLDPDTSIDNIRISK